MPTRQNVRNLLVDLTISEVRAMLTKALAAGNTRRAGYIEEFLCELDDDFDGCDVDDVDDDCITPAGWF